MVEDVHPGPYGSYPGWLTGIGGRVFFTARDGTHGPEVWTWDGDAKTHPTLVKNVGPGVHGSGPSYLTDVGGTLFFAADDGTHGTELWKSNGTDAGTTLFKDVNLGGRFTVASRGTPNTKNGTLRVRVTTEGAGHLAVGRVGKSLLKSSTYDPASAGATTVTLAPTAAGMRTLKRTGVLRVTARFTFTPCGGVGSSTNRSYTLRLK
jgi:ELWxxDGT repeat protein